MEKDKMKIISWNINGINARIGAIKELTGTEHPEIMCLQEIRTKNPHRYLDAIPGYSGITNVDKGCPGHAGVAIYIQNEILGATDLNHADKEGRILGIDIDGIQIISAYLPPGPHEKYMLMGRLATCLDQRRCVLCGDLNSVASDMDYHRLFTGREDCLPVDKSMMARFMKLLRLKDTYRELYPESRAYTYWPYTDRCRERNVGMRIDYILVTADIPVLEAGILGGIRGSDHCPVSMSIRARSVDGEKYG